MADSSIPSLLRQARRKKFPKSPLRYPGGKARAVEILLSLIPAGTTELVSPFFGGGSVEIAAASLGVRVQGYDVFAPLVDFWQALLADAPRLAERVRAYYPLAKERFYQLQKSAPEPGLENAAVFYVLNRCSFSGSTLSGGMSPGHPRFTPNAIAYLARFAAPNLRVDRGDFHDSIPRHPDALLYLDPPYRIDCPLYGKNGDAHKDFDHEDLCRLLTRRERWILSYNDCPEIRALYRGYPMFTPQWKYGMSADKQSRELLILSPDLAAVGADRFAARPMR